jgi:hypothetical protein
MTDDEFREALINAIQGIDSAITVLNDAWTEKNVETLLSILTRIAEALERSP